MRTLIFLCLLSVVALTFANTIPEDEEEEINKRFFIDFGKILGKIKKLFKDGFEKIKNGVKKFTKDVAKGGEFFGKLVTKEGKHFGEFFINHGHAVVKAAGKFYELSEPLFKAAKDKFEAEVKNVKFGEFLVKIFPILNTSAGNCQQMVTQLLSAAGAGPLASVGAGPIAEACKIRSHVIEGLKGELGINL